MACSGGALTHIEIGGKDRVKVNGGNILEDLLGDLGFDGFTNLNITSNKKLKNQGVEPGDISSTQLISFELEVLEPDNGDLSFFDSFDVYVKSPGLDPVLIARADDFERGQRVMSFEVMDVDLTEYVVSESMTITTDIVANSPEDDTVLRGSYLLDVGVTLQGAKNQACN